MNFEQLELYKKIDEILWLYWNPIGLNIQEKTLDEYSGYIPYIFKLKIQDADKHKIANYLYKLETIHLGLSGNKLNCNFVSEKIKNL
jgi:hypothetical protein